MTGAAIQEPSPIRTSPDRLLQFHPAHAAHDENGEGVKAQESLCLHNPSKSGIHLAFRITTNRKNGYITTPNIGVLSPGCSEDIIVTLADESLAATMDKVDKLRIETHQVASSFASIFSRESSVNFDEAERKKVLKAVWNDVSPESALAPVILQIAHNGHSDSNDPPPTKSRARTKSKTRSKSKEKFTTVSQQEKVSTAAFLATRRSSLPERPTHISSRRIYDQETKENAQNCFGSRDDTGAEDDDDMYAQFSSIRRRSSFATDIITHKTKTAEVNARIKSSEKNGNNNNPKFLGFLKIFGRPPSNGGNNDKLKNKSKCSSNNEMDRGSRHGTPSRRTRGQGQGQGRGRDATETPPTTEKTRSKSSDSLRLFPLRRRSNEMDWHHADAKHKKEERGRVPMPTHLHRRSSDITDSKRGKKSMVRRSKSSDAVRQMNDFLITDWDKKRFPDESDNSDDDSSASSAESFFEAKERQKEKNWGRRRMNSHGNNVDNDITKMRAIRSKSSDSVRQLITDWGESQYPDGGDFSDGFNESDVGISGMETWMNNEMESKMKDVIRRRRSDFSRRINGNSIGNIHTASSMNPKRSKSSDAARQLNGFLISDWGDAKSPDGAEDSDDESSGDEFDSSSALREFKEDETVVRGNGSGGRRYIQLDLSEDETVVIGNVGRRIDRQDESRSQRNTGSNRYGRHLSPKRERSISRDRETSHIPIHKETLHERASKHPLKNNSLTESITIENPMFRRDRQGKEQEQGPESNECLWDSIISTLTVCSNTKIEDREEIISKVLDHRRRNMRLSRSNSIPKHVHLLPPEFNQEEAPGPNTFDFDPSNFIHCNDTDTIDFTPSMKHLRQYQSSRCINGAERGLTRFDSVKLDQSTKSTKSNVDYRNNKMTTAVKSTKGMRRSAPANLEANLDLSEMITGMDIDLLDFDDDTEDDGKGKRKSRFFPWPK